MTEMILASILLPFAGGLLTLILPRSWIKVFSSLVAFLVAAAGIFVLVAFTAAGKTPLSVDVLFVGKWMVYGVTLDKLSVLIGAALGLVGFLIVVYATGYLTMQNREHPEEKVVRRFYFFLLLFIGSMAGLVYASTMLGLLIFFELTGCHLLGSDRLL